MPTDCPLLHDKGTDRYFDPSKAGHIRFVCPDPHEAPPALYAIVDGNGMDFIVTDPVALAELRNWCDAHTGSW